MVARGEGYGIRMLGFLLRNLEGSGTDYIVLWMREPSEQQGCGAM